MTQYEIACWKCFLHSNHYNNSTKCRFQTVISCFSRRYNCKLSVPVYGARVNNTSDQVQWSNQNCFENPGTFQENSGSLFALIPLNRSIYYIYTPVWWTGIKKGFCYRFIASDRVFVRISDISKIFQPILLKIQDPAPNHEP